MREIKFRAYYKSKQYDVADISFTKRGKIDLVRMAGESEYWNADKIVIVQYTGLKDKNDKEIYEGDLVLIVSNAQPKVVEWKATCCGFNIRPNRKNAKGYEVIGNVYEPRVEV